jgi:hypothetical protein
MHWPPTAPTPYNGDKSCLIEGSVTTAPNITNYHAWDRKIPQIFVDRIPLLIYIPPPPADSAQEKPALSYPPKLAVASPLPKMRFRFIRSLSTFRWKKKGTGADSFPEEEIDEHPGDSQTWEEHREQGGYPFVVLEDNRAVCTICLMDFEEPKRMGELPPNVALLNEQVNHAANQASTYNSF